MHVEPWRLKLQAATAVIIASVVIFFALIVRFTAPELVSGLSYFLILLMWPGAFAAGFAFISFVEAPELPLPWGDEWGGGGGHDDPPPVPPSPPGKPCRRRDRSRRTTAVAVPLRV